MLKRPGVILGLVLALILSFSYQSQASPREGTRSKHDSARAAPPLVKITPQPDGKFLLEPLTPPPPLKTIRLPLSQRLQKKKEVVPSLRLPASILWLLPRKSPIWF
jgi:hypothetical protein